ncbi:MAG: PcfK-like family protein [Muribaculaceae bacterium]|nr:PcfK-like family protein [Muribaculaceae bacterium]
MKGTEQFKQTIKAYLDKRAIEDALFAKKYIESPRTIDDVVTYILNQVKASGCCGFSDEEIYGMAVHGIDEPDLDIGKPINCNVVVNHHVELTDEEKTEQKAIALKRFQDEEFRKLEQRNKPKVKPQIEQQPQLSLFDEL